MHKLPKPHSSFTWTLDHIHAQRKRNSIHPPFLPAKSHSKGISWQPASRRGTITVTNNSLTVHVGASALSEDLKNVSTDTPDLWLDRWLAVSPLSLFLSLIFSFVLSLQSLLSLPQISPVACNPSAYCTPVCNTNTRTVLTCKYLHTRKHTHSSSQQAVCSVWVSHCTGRLSLCPPTVGKQCSSLVQNSGARHSPIEQTSPSVLGASLK